MCGIIGYVGPKPMKDVLIKGLKRLEYRGYDSSGVAYFKDGDIVVHKSAGKIAEIETTLGDDSSPTTQGAIGHTRWATHGKPNSTNAHPHRVGDIVLVHNGIIENYQEIAALVRAKGLEPKSETDSELFGFLVHFEMERGTPFVEAVRLSFLKITGSCSVVVMNRKNPGLIVGIRNGSPLVASSDSKHGTMLASDAQPILDYSKEVYFLENGDMVVCRMGDIQFLDLKSGRPLRRDVSKLDWSADRLDKQGYPHYMLKEIYEQPLTLRETLGNYLEIGSKTPFDIKDHSAIELLSKVRRISFAACGTSWHASLLGKYWIERWADVTVDTEHSSEFRYRSPCMRSNEVTIGISQSGETADTLAVIQQVRDHRIPTVAITNVKGSTLSREATHALYTYAGPEIGVASTKAFTAQLTMLLLIAGRLGRDNPETKAEIQKVHQELFELPHHLARAIELEGPTVEKTRKAAKASENSNGFFFIGRGYSYPIALEAALKLKEIAYVHAEGYPAGELKHGPIAMLDRDMTVVVLCPKDHWHAKTLSNLQEVKARGARLIAIGHEDDQELQSMVDHFIPLPISGGGLSEALIPFLMAPVLQLFSYEIALLKGTDVDQPRNLAKSVTVE